MAAFLTVEETAELLRCCPDTVRAGIKRGEVPARQIGRTIRIPANWLNDAAARPAESSPTAA